MSSNIRFPEMIDNVSWSQLRLSPIVWYTLHARVLTFITITLWLLALTTAGRGLEKSQWAIGSAKMTGLLVCMGGLSLLNSVRLWRGCKTTPVFSNYTRFVFTLLLVWCMVTIMRVDWFNWRWEVRLMWGGQTFAWAWVVPVSMVLGSDIGIWRRALRTVVSIGAIGCIILIAGWALISLHGDFALTRACPIVLLFWHYLSKQTRRIALFGAFVTVFLSVLSATRNEVFSGGLLILFAIYIQFFRYHPWRLITRVFIMFMLSMVFVIGAYIASVDSVPFVGYTINAGITQFKEKLFKDTRRTDDSDSLYKQFFQSVGGRDLVIGRGCMGRYNFKYATPDGPFRGYQGTYRERWNVECGYLQIILNGGVIMLVLILSLAIPAIYLGMFRSKNWFTRGCSFIVLGRLLEMVPFGLPIADVQYVLFWMAIGACLTWKIRAMSDADIIGIFTYEYALGMEEER